MRELAIELIPRLPIERVISAEAAPDSPQELLFLKRFPQEISCTGLDRPDSHRDVAITRQEDDREVDSGSPLLLHVESAQPGELDI